MRVATVAVAYNEERLIGPHLDHIPDWVEEKLVLVSASPWQGKAELPDRTDEIAEAQGATVIVHDWPTEEDQRNAGQDYLHDYDWVVVLDPDEFLSKSSWVKLRRLLSEEIPDANVVAHQRVFWKDKEISPHTDYQQIILVRPSVRFVDKRVVDSAWGTLPVELLHFSWARTNDEIWSKITHYAHADEFNKERWYEEVWLGNKTENLHPLTPETLKGLVPAKLPADIKRLGLLCKPSKT